MEAALDKWEEQGKVLKKDFGEEFSDTVPVGIVTAMMPESIQQFVHSSLGVAVEYDAILAKIRALVSNKVAMADGPTPMDVDKVSVDYAKVQTVYSVNDHEIDVVNMSIQCHGCGGWGHYKSKCPTALVVMQEQHQVGNNGSKGLGKGGKNSAKGIGGFGKGCKGGKGVFPGRCFKCGEAGHRKRDIAFGCADTGNVDVDGGWEVKKNPKKVSLAWCPLGLTRTALRSRTGHENRVAATHAPTNGCRFQALQEEEGFTESEDRTCMVCGVDDEKLTHEAQLEFCEADVRKPLASAVRLAKAENGIWLEAHGGYIENLATKERMEVHEENGVYVMDVQFDDETVDVITLDSGAGCNVWPKGRCAGKTSKLLPKKAGAGMVAANGTPHRVPRAQASSFPWCSKELEFSQAEVSRESCVDHIVRPSGGDSKEVVARWVCGQEDEESHRGGAGGRDRERFQDGEEGLGSSRTIQRGTRAARNDSLALSQSVQTLRSRPWEADAAPSWFSRNEHDRGAHGLRVLGSRR